MKRSMISVGNWLGSQNPPTTQETLISTSGFGAMARRPAAPRSTRSNVKGGYEFSGTFNLDGTTEGYGLRCAAGHAGELLRQETI